MSLVVIVKSNNSRSKNNHCSSCLRGRSWWGVIGDGDGDGQGNGKKNMMIRTLPIPVIVNQSLCLSVLITPVRLQKAMRLPLRSPAKIETFEREKTLNCKP